MTLFHIIRELANEIAYARVYKEELDYETMDELYTRFNKELEKIIDNRIKQQNETKKKHDRRGLRDL